MWRFSHVAVFLAPVGLLFRMLVCQFTTCRFSACRFSVCQLSMSVFRAPVSVCRLAANWLPMGRFAVCCFSACRFSMSVLHMPVFPVTNFLRSVSAAAHVGFPCPSRNNPITKLISSVVDFREVPPLRVRIASAAAKKAKTYNKKTPNQQKEQPTTAKHNQQTKTKTSDEAPTKLRRCQQTINRQQKQRQTNRKTTNNSNK